MLILYMPKIGIGLHNFNHSERVERIIMFKNIRQINNRQIPDGELPYEKCEKHGAANLSDAELLAVILRTGTSGKTAVELARDILASEPGGLLNLYRMSREELQRYQGIGRVKAIQLKCIGEISKRISMARHFQGITLNDARAVANYYMEQLRYEEREVLLVSMYDAKCRLIGDEMISVGTVNASLVSPREIFLRAVGRHAVTIILLHNHPSGVPEPSTADKRVTEQVKLCGELLGIRLSDHIIIGDNRYYSFKEQGLV